MSRRLFRSVLLVVALVASACQATVPESGDASPSGTASTPPLSTATTAPRISGPGEETAGRAAPVTTAMAELNLSGEPYAVQGDPNAPLTVVEFSDFG